MLEKRVSSRPNRWRRDPIVLGGVLMSAKATTRCGGRILSLKRLSRLTSAHGRRGAAATNFACLPHSDSIAFRRNHQLMKRLLGCFRLSSANKQQGSATNPTPAMRSAQVITRSATTLSATSARAPQTQTYIRFVQVLCARTVRLAADAINQTDDGWR
jgi:hypothetical protein